MNFLDDVYKELSAINEGTIKEEVIVPVEDAIKDNDTGIDDAETFLEYLITEASVEFHAVYENYVYDRLKNSETGKAIAKFIEALLKKIKEIYGSFKAFVKKWVNIIKAKAKKMYDDLTKNKADVEDCETEERKTTARDTIANGGTVNANYCIYQIRSSDIKIAYESVLNVDSNRGITYDLSKIDVDNVDVINRMYDKFNEVSQSRTDAFFTELLAHTLVKVKTSKIDELKSEIIRINGFKTVEVNKSNLLTVLTDLQKLISSETDAAMELDKDISMAVTNIANIKKNSRDNMFASAETIGERGFKFVARAAAINVHVLQCALVAASAMNTTIQKSIATFEELSGGEY